MGGHRFWVRFLSVWLQCARGTQQRSLVNSPTQNIPPPPNQHQARASHPALLPHEYEALFAEHTRALEDALVAGAKEALGQILGPLLPKQLAAAAAKAAAAKAAAAKAAAPSSGDPSSSGQPEWPRVDPARLAPPLTSYPGLLNSGGLMDSLEGDARWGRASPDAR